MLYIRLQPFFFQVQLYKIEINMESTRKTTYQKKKSTRKTYGRIHFLNAVSS